MPTNDNRSTACRPAGPRQQAGPRILAQRHRAQHGDQEKRATRDRHAMVGAAETATAVTA
ncbi:hypothetical protein AB0C02_32970 [Micromonospora sp. NPDC048999]|uniref:hypothetical protein n=1 Tax=Micromonospora sp. NPDC048999 TaxID=3155391 RepID=UPI0033EFF842